MFLLIAPWLINKKMFSHIKSEFKIDSVKTLHLCENLMCTLIYHLRLQFIFDVISEYKYKYIQLEI